MKEGSHKGKVIQVAEKRLKRANGINCNLCLKASCICVKRTAPVKSVNLSEADVKINEDFVRQSSYARPGWDGWD